MRTFLVGGVLSGFALFHAWAGQLDLAVVQFPEAKTVEELNAAFARIDLAQITNADRTVTKESYLKGGYVVFAQSLNVSPGEIFSSATRIRNQRADVEGQLGQGMVAVKVSLAEGVKAGLRTFEKKVYLGSGPLPSQAPQVLSMRVIKVRSPKVTKGQSRVENSQSSTAVIAQYRS